jgi:hypothetical protein
LNFIIGELIVRNTAEEKWMRLLAHRETKMKNQQNVGEDLQLVILMIAKLLKSDHGIDGPLTRNDFSLIDSRRYPHGGQELRVRVKIDRGVSVDVDHFWRGEGASDLRTLTATATEVARAIGDIHSRRVSITEMLEEVRAAARKEVSKARRRGLPYRLISATLVQLDDDGKIFVQLWIQNLGVNLRHHQSSVRATRQEDVRQALAEWEEVQISRARVRDAMGAAGASGQIDGVVVNALREAGHDMADVLEQLAIEDDWIVDIGKGEENKKTFCLYWKDGQVFSSLAVDDGSSWTEGRLHFQKTPVALTGAKGKRVRDILSNPIFGDGIKVISTFGEKGGQGALFCTQEMLNFDIDTGRLWAA